MIKVFFFQLLLGISIALPYIGYAFFIFVWWPHRRDSRFSSIPWLVASVIITFILSLITPRIAALFPDWTSSPTAALIIASAYFSFTYLFFQGVRFFVILWMITANLAYLICENSPGNRVTYYFASLHSYQRNFGIVLLSLTLIPFCILFVQCFSGCPPHFK